ncbi:MAG: PIN domain-containing protein [Nanoarchaeota archaeon]
MSEKYYYFDTSIWIDIYDKRGYNGEIAMKLMQRIIVENFSVIYSDMNIIEFKDVGFSDYEINQMLSTAKPDNIKLVHPTKEQIIEAKRLARQRDVPKGDALHAVLARDHGAQIVATDLKDFNKLKDITTMKKPEELI